MEQPRFSVIVTAYDSDRFEDVVAAVDSVLEGTYEDREVILVVDGNDSLHERLGRIWDGGDVSVLLNDRNIGAAASRNRAAEHSTGGILAFMDDDAVADERWLERLATCYTEHDALAAGGRMEPIWLAGEPEFLPPEFYWLVGVTYRGYPEELTEVRNTFASNLSFDRDVFDVLGGFNPDAGPTGESLMQSAETELCARLAEETGRGVLYNPDAVVRHKVYAYRTDPVFLLRRAFWQGVSKRGMQVYSGAGLRSESDFLRLLVTQSLPERVWEVVVGPRRRGLAELTFLLLATAAVGLGFLWGFVRFRPD